MPKNSTPSPEPDTAPDASDSAAAGDTPPPAPDAQPAPAPLAGNRFFAWMRSLGITREPGWIGGVSAGIAARLGVDPLIVRGVFVVVAVLGGPALLLYAAAWLLLPDRGDKIHLEEVFKGRLESPIAGIGALVLFSMLPVTQGFWFAGSAFWGEPFWGASAGRALWTIVLLGLIVWFVAYVARRSGRPQPATRPAAPTTTADAQAGSPVQPASAASAPPVAYSVPGERPAAHAATASQEEFTAWRAQQALWKAENDAFRAQQVSEQRAASAAAHEQYRVEREARRVQERARHARTRSNPLYSFVAIGLAFVTGGIVTLTVGDGSVPPAALLAGLGAMLGVLALAIIVNGARGRRPGGSQGLAAVVLVVILVAAVLPHGPNISYAENARFTPAPLDTGLSVENYFVGSGDTVIDLRDYFAEPVPSYQTDQVYGNLSLFAGVGDVTVIVPEDAQLGFSTQIGRGSVDAAGLGLPDTPALVEGSGDLNLPTESPDAEVSARVLYLRIALGAGDVVFQRAPATGNTIEGSN